MNKQTLMPFAVKLIALRETESAFGLYDFELGWESSFISAVHIMNRHGMSPSSLPDVFGDDIEKVKKALNVDGKRRHSLLTHNHGRWLQRWIDAVNY